MVRLQTKKRTELSLMAQHRLKILKKRKEYMRKIALSKVWQTNYKYETEIEPSDATIDMQSYFVNDLNQTIKIGHNQAVLEEEIQADELSEQSKHSVSRKKSNNQLSLMARYRFKVLARRKQRKLRKLAFANVWQSNDNYDLQSYFENKMGQTNEVGDNQATLNEESHGDEFSEQCEHLVKSNNDGKNLSLMAQHRLEMLEKRKLHKGRKGETEIEPNRASIDVQRNCFENDMRHSFDSYGNQNFSGGETGDYESMIDGIQNDSRGNGFSFNNVHQVSGSPSNIFTGVATNVRTSQSQVKKISSVQSNKGSIWLSLDAYRKSKENSIQPNRGSERSNQNGDSYHTEEYQSDAFNGSMNVENLDYESSEQIDDQVYSDEYQSDETRNGDSVHFDEYQSDEAQNNYPDFFDMENGGYESLEHNEDSVDDNQIGYPGAVQLVYQNQWNIYTDDRRVIYSAIFHF